MNQQDTGSTNTRRLLNIVALLCAVVACAMIVLVVIVYKNDAAQQQNNAASETTEASTETDTDEATDADEITVEQTQELTSTLSDKSFVVFNNSIQTDGIELVLKQGDESKTVDLSSCKIYLDGSEAQLNDDATLSLDGLSAGTHEVTFDYADGDTVLSTTSSITVEEPYGGMNDSELIAMGQDNILPMFTMIFNMRMCRFPDFTWNETTKVGNEVAYRIIGADSISEVKELWYQSFSEKYTIEEATNMENALNLYREVNGALYTITGGVGWESDIYEVESVERSSRDEVIFKGYYASSYFPSAGSEYIEFSMVYENGSWKYGYMRY